MPKRMLASYCREFGRVPEYQTYKIDTPDCRTTYESCVKVAEHVHYFGQGYSREYAEIDAAMEAVKDLYHGRFPDQGDTVRCMEQ